MAKSASKEGLPAGWLLSGSHAADYQAKVDNSMIREGSKSVCLESKKDSAQGFGTWMTMVKPGSHLGKRVSMKAWLKTSDVQNNVQPWIRVDGRGKGVVLSFDNFCERMIAGNTNWTLYESVVSVPSDSTGLAYGVMLAGPGKVWMGDFILETVADEIPTTDCICMDEISGNRKPDSKRSIVKEDSCGQQAASNVNGWIMAGSHPEQYVASIDTSTFHSGSRSALLKNDRENAENFGTLMQTCSPHIYAGKRIRMTAWVKSSEVRAWAAPWLRVDGPNSDCLAFDNCCKRPLVGSKDWTSYEIVLDVPLHSTNLAYGVLLSGDGKVWMDDFSFEEVELNVPLTHCPCSNSSHQNLNFEDD